MECSFDKERLSALLTGTVSEQERDAIESHLSGCAGCRMAFKSYNKLWLLMEEVPEPVVPGNMQHSFENMLSDFKLAATKEPKENAPLFERVLNRFQFQVKPNFAFSILLLFAGLAIGYLINKPEKQTSIAYNRHIDSLSSQVMEMKQMMMLSLLENPSASQRIQAVGYTDEINKVNKKVIDALFTTLNGDPNVNVRLITLEALAKLAKETSVREGLVRSISLQDSPLMQSAIADIMVKLQEKRSIQFLKLLLNKKDLNEMVRLKIEQSIHQLI